MSVDYKDTLRLPRTDFPMKAGLPQKEPLLLERWEKIGLEARLREQSKAREKFILHDGPPYANGHLHIGHALNKILKDVINRSQQMMGKNAHYVPGWDCHGLPIEWKIEEKYRAAGKDKDEVPIIEFRKECRDFAAHWIDVQREEFKRLGVGGDWENPYTTMAYAAEAQIAREIGKFLMNGGLFKGSKPVMWSVVEKTALAEAEVEYHDHTSTTVHVRFPVAKASRPELEGASVVIWTTTPWTMPGNRAVAYGEDIDYVVEQVVDREDDCAFNEADKFVVAKGLLAAFQESTGIRGSVNVATFKGDDLAGTVCRHPLHGKGYDFDVRLLPGDFVSDEDGTGFVHIAPGHGADDYVLGMANGVEVPQTVGEDGCYYDHVPLFAGLAVYTHEGKTGPANKAVVEALRESGNLMASGKLRHSYPHSWRSKAPLIFRNTAQWFISMETNNLRSKALAAIDESRSRFSWRKPAASRCATRAWWTASPRPSKPRAPMPGSPATRPISLAPTAIPRITSKSRTWSMSGSIPARRTPSCWRRATICNGRRRFTWKAPTSIAAGSTPRCWKAPARAAGRPTRVC
jgi:isoleucyl-tRNA synthetase